MATASFAVMLLCGAAAALLLAARVAYHPGWTLQGELEYGDFMLSQYKPAELWDLWSVYRQEGLGRQNPPEHVLMQRQLEAWDPYMYAAFGLAAAGLVGWLATIFTAPRKKPPQP